MSAVHIVFNHKNDREIVLFNEALDFAKHAHREQTRKYNGDPYWTHLVRVATRVSNIPGRSTDAVLASLLHDTVEDTHVKIDDIKSAFGGGVSDYVGWLTNPPLSYGNRAARKAYVINKLKSAPVEVKSIKCVDIADNSLDLMKNDPNFAPKAFAERLELLEALRGADSEVWNEAHSLILNKGNSNVGVNASAV